MYMCTCAYFYMYIYTYTYIFTYVLYVCLYAYKTNIYKIHESIEKNIELFNSTTTPHTYFTYTTKLTSAPLFLKYFHFILFS